MKKLRNLLALALVLLLILQVLPVGWAAGREAGGTIGAAVSSETPEQEPPAPDPTAEALEPETTAPAESAPSKEEKEPEERQFGTGWVEDELPPSNDWISDAHLALPQTDRSIPAKYDSRDSGIVTPVRNQGGYGTCWAHASLACVETYMIKNGIVDASTGEAATTDINLSEYHLAWYTYTDAYDALGMLDGDTTTAILDPNVEGDSYLDKGGSGLMAGITMLRGEGPASESVSGLQYSQTSTQGLGDSYAFNNNVARVTDIILIPVSDRNAIKQSIMEYGAGVFAYHHDSTYLNSSNGAYCFIQTAQPGSAAYIGSNHIVAAVGWDDNYSKENFRKGHRPNNDGAWIIKGSYGVDRGDNGYYYLSYEDTVNLNSSACFFTVADNSVYDNIYQYDGTQANTYYPSKQSSTRFANVFTANGNESLEAVNIVTNGQGISYTVDIYTDLETSDPTSGLYVASESGTFTYSGAHTVSIPSIPLHPNETYSVVFTLSCPTANDSGVYFWVMKDKSSTRTDMYTTTHAKRENVSYNSQGEIWKQLESGAETFRIKAFTKDIDPEFREKTVTLKQGEYKEYQLKALCSDGRDLEDIHVMSGSVPPGMYTMFKPSLKLVFGTPEESGTFTVRYAVTYTDGSLAYCTVHFRVLSNTPVPSSEFLSMQETWEANCPLHIDYGGASVTDWAVSSGSIPPGMSLSFDSAGKPSLTGTPHKKGNFVFNLSLVMSSGETLEHRVRCVVYVPGNPIDQISVVLNHGPFSMPRNEFNAHFIITARALVNEGRMRILEQPNRCSFDLNADGSWDLFAEYKGDYYLFRTNSGGCLLCDYKLTLSDDTLANLSGRSDFAKVLYLSPPQKPIPSYSMDLNLGPKEIPFEEYVGHLLQPLGVLARDGQIRMSVSGSDTLIDLDNDGNDDILLELSLTRARFSVVDTNNAAVITRKLTAAQAEELADTCSALSLRFLLPEPAVRYPLYVDNVQVTSRNRGDILGNGVFSFDGKTLYIHGSCSLTDGVYSELPNLYIYTSEDSILTVSNMGIELRENAMLWGPGKLTIQGSRVAVYLNEGNVRLRIYYTELHASGAWGIAGESRNERLTIDNANVIAHGDSGAICDIAGGISIVDAKLAEPVGGSVGAAAVLNPDGSKAKDAVIYSIRHYNPFVDVKEGAFYYDAVLWAVNSDPQITTGTDDTHFSPKKDCTRAQVVTFLWRAAGCPEPVSTGCAFTDVKPGAYYYKAVLWAVENNITSGASATKFAPDKACTRAQVVTFLWRAKGSPKPTQTTHPFQDVKPGAYYYDAMLWALEWEITNGLTSATFGPDKTCNRGQVVTFLYRAFGPQG